MKKFICLFTIFCMSIFLSVSFVQGMENDPCSSALLVELTAEHGIADQSLINSIKILIKLSTLNKNFNGALTVEKIGSLCKKYSDYTKALMIRDNLFGWEIHPREYKPLAIVFSAGLGRYTDRVNNLVLKNVINHIASSSKEDFTPVVELLFKNKANPNRTTEINGPCPLFFKVKTVELAQLFYNNGVDIHAVGGIDSTNVLWCAVSDDYPSELMQFYLDCGVDPKKLNRKGECLLHGLLDQCNLIEDMDNYLKKFELILNVIPDMINLTVGCQTPTDCLPRKYRSKNNQLFTLLRQHGGLTSFECEPYYSDWEKRVCDARMLIETGSADSFAIKNAVVEPKYAFLIEDGPKVANLKNIIESFMQIRATCKHYQELFTGATIGDLCKNHDQLVKNHILNELVQNIQTSNYCLPIFILLCAGAEIKNEQDKTLLLSVAVLGDNVQLIKTLFKQGANSNLISDGNFSGFMPGEPIFFRVKTEEIAREFIENKVNVQMYDSFGFNVLWKVIEDEYPSNLLKFYLARKVYSRLQSGESKRCLWHEIASKSVDNDLFLEKMCILFEFIPDMINALNSDKKTPLDFANTSVGWKGHNGQTNKQCIALLRQYGALTAQEFAQQK